MNMPAVRLLFFPPGKFTLWCSTKDKVNHVTILNLIDCHGLTLSWFEIAITSVTSLLANQHIASVAEMCVYVHAISVKRQQSV